MRDEVPARPGLHGLPGLIDVPVRGALVPAVGHQERVEAVGQGVHPDPRGQRECVELARHVQPHAVADLLEFQALAPRPAARPPRAAHHDAVVGLLPPARLVGQHPTPGLLGLEGVVVGAPLPGDLPPIDQAGRLRVAVEQVDVDPAWPDIAAAPEVDSQALAAAEHL